MKQPTQRSTSGRGWRAVTPSFPDCAGMDDFYAEAHRLIEAKFTAYRESGGTGFCTADYLISEDRGDTVITLRLRLRENGRYAAEKTATHRWRGGYLAPKREHLRIRSFLQYIISKIDPAYKRKMRG